MKLKSKWVIAPLAVTGFMALFFFQNCARTNNNNPSEAPTYSSGIQNITLSQNLREDVNICFKGDFKCYRKIYSSQLTDDLKHETDCVEIEDKKVCVNVVINTYNTTEALAACTDCEPNSVNANRYEREEVTCWLRVGSSSNPAMFALRANLSESLSEVINSCRASLLSKGAL